LRQAEQCWKAGENPLVFAKEHREFARAFESFPHDADTLYPEWRQQLADVA
jgi:ribulose-bisphosphate carboxylase large chain